MPRRGGKRRKSRTHVDPTGAKNAPNAASEYSKVPKSLVVRRGKVSKHVSMLTDELRKLMLPHTAIKLREKTSNTMKDYIQVAGPLGISHLLAVSQTEKGPTLRVGRLPSGPTLTFKVNRYALGAHIKQSQRKPVDATAAYHTSPLVVLNNFDTNPQETGKRHLHIAALTFQAMFPSINVKSVELSQCRRVVLISYNEEEGLMEFRHYMIRANPSGVSRSVKKLLKSKIPNLNKVKDISEMILENSFGGGAGYATSDSEFEEEDACVTMPKSYNAGGRGNIAASQSMIKLVEIGPRMTLQLLKIEDGAFDGEVQYHAFIERSEEEVKELQDKHREKEELREARRQEQEENVKRKKEAAEAKEKAKVERRRLRDLKRKQEEAAAEDSDEADVESEGDDEEMSGEEEEEMSGEDDEEMSHEQDAASGEEEAAGEDEQEDEESAESDAPPVRSPSKKSKKTKASAKKQSLKKPSKKAAKKPSKKTTKQPAKKKARKSRE